MNKLTKMLFIFAVVAILIGCGGGGNKDLSKNKAPDDTKVVYTLQDKNNTVIVDNSKSKEIISKSVDEHNSSLKVIKISKDLANSIKNKKIVIIEPNKQFPLGYTGKIVSSTNDGNNKKVLLEDVSLEDIKEIKLPKEQYDISKMHYVGMITPTGVYKNDVSKNNKHLKVIVDKKFPVYFDGKDINLKNNLNNKYVYHINNNLSLELSGKISNLKINNMANLK